MANSEPVEYAMPESLTPATAEELRDALRSCSDEQASVESGGAFSKRLAGGPIAKAKYRLGTSRLNRLRAYEPADLTISVGAGMRIAELNRILESGNQFLPLDPPFAERATVGGVLATNSSGYRRRRFGTARDMVIGMRFATLDGKLVSSGGMVVKNVTGTRHGQADDRVLRDTGGDCAQSTSRSSPSPNPLPRFSSGHPPSRHCWMSGAKSWAACCSQSPSTGSIQERASSWAWGTGMAY